MGIVVFCLLFAWFVFYIPNYLGDADNYIPANPAVTPSHIVPEWYYLPFYAILRSIPNKLLGVLRAVLFDLILLLRAVARHLAGEIGDLSAALPQFFWLFVITCVLLGWLGSKPPEGGYVIVSRLLTAWYFIHFLIVLPLLGLVEQPSRCRPRFAEPALKRGKAAAIAAACGRPRRCAARRGSPTPAAAQVAEQETPPRNAWSFSGLFGVYDTAQLQRGFKVYHDVCQAVTACPWCRSAISARRAGRNSPSAEVAAIAAEYMVTDGPNDMGDMFKRPGRPADHFPPPFANEQQARFALGGALPPDMSVLAKARELRARVSLVPAGYRRPVPGARRRLHRRRSSRATRRSPPA